MRVLLDTNVLVRATPTSRGGPAWEVLQRILTGRHILVTSPPLLLELEDVLRRPRVQKSLKLGDDEAGGICLRLMFPTTRKTPPWCKPPSWGELRCSALAIGTSCIRRDLLFARPMAFAFYRTSNLLSELRAAEPGVL